MAVKKQPDNPGQMSFGDFDKWQKKEREKHKPVEEPALETVEPPVVVAEPENKPIFRKKKEEEKSDVWGAEIAELEAFFKEKKLPKTAQLNQCSTITDVKQFVKTNLLYVKEHNGDDDYRAYLDSLIELKNLLKKD
jgi:hypothetical protein